MNSRLRVLLIEDSEDDASILLIELKRAGYEPVWERVHSEANIRESLREKEWDVIICDYYLPGLSGLEALQFIKQLTETPVLIVSGKIGEETAVEALKAGAEDYLLKDRLARLGSAVKRALREASLRRMKRAADKALHESEERYRRIVETSPDAMMIVGDGKFVYVNPAAVKLFGANTPMDLLGKAPMEFIDLQQQEVLKHLLDQAMQGKDGPPLEVQIRRFGSSMGVVELAIRAIQYHQERALQLICRDISARRQLEKEMQSSQRMEAIARLAAGVAHDFNNLLTVLLGHLGLIRSSIRSGDAIFGDVQHATTVAERAFHLTHQLLALSRKQTLALIPLSLNTVISQTHSLLLRTLREEIQLSLFLAPDLKLSRLDAGQLEHVLLNLAAHARATMPQGGKLFIETSNVRFSPKDVDKPADIVAGDYVLMKVADTGAGLAEEAKQQIFEPFVTPAGSLSPGLALATVYGIIRQHDGHIYCQSELGKGSTFKIYLPVHLEPQHAVPEIRPKAAPDSPKTVLVVEDEDVLREFAQLILHKNGFTVISARDGHEALQICQREHQRIDLIFTDVVMPSMNGPEFVRGLPKYRNSVPVIFTSGYTEPVLVEQGFEVTDRQFLPKPYTVQGLVAKIKEALANSAVE